MGNEEIPGIMSLTLRELFDQIFVKSEENKFLVRISFIEVYNETLRDLLNDSEDVILDIREDPEKGIVITGVTEYLVKTENDVMHYLRYGKSLSNNC